MVVSQVIEDGWAASGWEEGPRGYPVDDVVARPGGIWQEFEDGGVYWREATASRGVSGETHDVYGARRGTTGVLGHPTTEESCGLRGGGCGQAFHGGSIHWSPTGAQATTGAIRNTWARSRWENGRPGYPVGDETFYGGGYRQILQGGIITIPVDTWVPRTSYR